MKAFFHIVVASLFFLDGASPAQAEIFIVNSLGDAADPNAGEPGDDGIASTGNTVPSGEQEVTLRAAIQNHNAKRNLGQNEIHFNVDLQQIGALTATIQVGSTGLGSLPFVLGSCIIDATTQPGAVAMVEIDGSLAGGGANGVELRGSNSTLRGMVINRFAGAGVVISGTGPPGGGGHQIEGCFIGTSFDGTAALGNGGDGIFIERGTPNNIIGGPDPEDRNVISDNGGDGIRVENVGFLPFASVNRIRRNFIGTDVTGAVDFGNDGHGIHVLVTEAGPGTPMVTEIGGAGEDFRNLISGNGGSGVMLESDAAMPPIVNHLVQGNWIGLNAAGDAALANDHDGVTLRDNCGNNSIGGIQAGEGNTISGNGQNGVHLSGALATGNLILQNTIGLNSSGTGAIPNAADGVLIDGSPNNTIGQVFFTPPNVIDDAGNTISGNAGNGVRITGAGATNNQVLTNLIGVIGNGGDGVRIEGAPANVVGEVFLDPNGNEVLAGNGIGQNLGNGVQIIGPAAANNQISSNSISGNTLAGLHLNGSPNTPVMNNTLSFNKQSGVRIEGATATANQLEGNTIGGNTMQGVIILNAPGNTIGIAGNGNFMQGNLAAGVQVEGDGAIRNRIQFNSILGNGQLGIDLIPTGVTPNDALDADVGPNNRQNFPVITSAFTTTPLNPALPPFTTITGSLHSAPNTNFTIEFFVAAPDPSGFGEGDVSLGTQLVATDASGNASFTFNFPGIPVGLSVTATATDPLGNTSEFSNFLEITAAIPAVVTITASDPNASETGPEPGEFTVSRSGAVDLLSPLTVQFTVSGSAALGADYGEIGTSVTIPIGQLSQTIPISPVTDNLTEGTETVVVTLAPNVNYVIGTQNTATVNITDSVAGGGGNIQQLLQQLIDRIQALPFLSQGQKNSLIQKLVAAQNAFARGDRRAGINQLRAFANEVLALIRSRRIDLATANSLMQQVQGVARAASP